MSEAWQYDRYGGIEVLRWGPSPRPRARGRDVVVRVEAAALNPKDALFRKGRFALISGRRFPKYVGLDFAGEVVEGSDLPVGTPVFGAIDEWRFVRGSLATHLVAHGEEVAARPDGMSAELAAALPLAGQTALQALRDLGQVRAGTRVVVNGAAGGVGTLAIQIAAALGAEVTSISSAKNTDMCLSLGAREALAYDKGDPFAGRRWQVFFDVYGNRPFDPTFLDAGGVYISTVPSVRTALDAVRTLVSSRRARPIRVRARRLDLEALGAMWQAGKLVPVIDRVVPMSEVPEAFRHLETRHARGKIVIRL